MPPLKVQRPTVVLFDLCGTVIKEFFIQKGLWPYVRDYLRNYLTENWNQPNVRADLSALRSESSTNPSAPSIVGEGQEREAVIDSVVAYVNHCLDHTADVSKCETRALTMLRFHMWFDAYHRKYIETPVFSDVAIQIQKWRCELDIKLHVLSNGWSEASRRFLSHTTFGDLNLLIDGIHDGNGSSLTDPVTYRKLLRRLDQPANQVLFLTKSAEEGQAAARAGLIVVLCLTHRATIAKLDSVANKMPRVRTFNQIQFTDA